MALPETKLIRGQGDCIRISRIRDYEFLDDKNLIVWASRRKAYRVELMFSCVNLRDAIGLEFRSRLGRLCGGAGEYVVAGSLFRDREETGRSIDDCSVRSVQALDEESLYELSIVTGKLPPPPPLPSPELEMPDPELPGPASPESEAVDEPVVTEPLDDRLGDDL